ncbi:MAG: DNA polymerase III subunit gamma/tau [bacterium]
MSYRVMARRWRPQTFAEVIGQEHVTRTLQRAIARGRVAHAYIFTGPRGVGKTTTARLLAKAVNYHNQQTNSEGLPEPCNNCPACNDITSGNALDVIEIDGASNNRVDDVRQLRETVKYTPTSLQKKIYIIDEVHMLSVSAFNALLKTLEEPPDHAMFIFATTEIHKVPATVLSRCQRFDFKRISTREIRRQLEKIVKGDKLQVDEEAQVSIALKAEGALRDALSVLDQLVAFQGDDPITGDIVRQALGLIGTEIYFRTTDVAATGEVGKALELAEAIAGGGHDPREYLHGLQQHVLRFLFLKAGAKANELDVAEEDRKRYSESKDRLSDEDLLRIGEWAAEAEDLLRDALDPQVRLELLLVRIARMDRAVDLGALLERMGVQAGQFQQPVTRTKEKTPSEPKPVPKSAESKTAAAPAEKTRPSSKNEDIPPEDDEGDDSDDGPPPPEPPKAPSGPVPSQVPEEEVDEGDEEVNGDHGEPSTPENGQLTLVDVRSGWLGLCDEVSRERRTLGVALEAGAPTMIENGAVEVTFEPDFRFDHDQVLRNRDLVAQAFRKYFGVSKRIVVKTGAIPETAKPPHRKTQSEERRERFEKLLEERPVWREMIERLELKMNGNT